MLNFLSLNVGMSASLAGLATLIPAQGLDIIFLQEVRLTREEKLACEGCCHCYDLCDVFRFKFPRREEFTFFRSGKAPSRLDRLYTSRGLLESLSVVRHVASLSDHCGVLMEIELNVDLLSIPKLKRRTYWKLNTSILEEKEFLTGFAAFWVRISKSKESFSDIAEWWDKFAKPEIRDFCVGFSFQRKMQREHTKKFLFSYLKLALIDKNWEEVARIREKLDVMLKADTMGVVVRSRFKQNAEHDKASLYHAAREARNDKSNITKLKVGKDVIDDRLTIEEIVIFLMDITMKI